MAKLSRNSLKALVKECLVEILAEGIGKASPGTKGQKATAPVRRRASPKIQQKPAVEQTAEFDSVVEKTVSNLTSDSVMQEIFADTARTTLQEQNKHDTSRGASTPGALTNPIGDSGVNLNGIFDSAKSSWSDIAFGETEK